MIELYHSTLSQGKSNDYRFIRLRSWLLILALLSIGFIKVRPAAAQCGYHFGTEAVYSTGLFPRSIVIGDINNDGVPDLATANAGNNTVGILMGNGNGTFQSVVHHQVGTTPYAVAIGDINNDGGLDVVAANRESNTISILFNDLNGSLLPKTDHPVGNVPQALAINDLNNDNNLDIVVGNAGGGIVSVMLGHGDGSFDMPFSLSISGESTCVVVADANGDGHFDIIASDNGSSGSIKLFRGNGNGTFEIGVSIGMNGGAPAFAFEDINGDGIVDMVSTDLGITPFLGNGDGTFRRMSDAPAVNPTSIALADFDSDHRMDVLVGMFANSGGAVGKGNGNGTFSPNAGIGIQEKSYSVAIGDLNGDGQPDIVASRYAAVVSVLLGESPSIWIRQQPTSQFSEVGQNVTFSISALNAVSYRWRHNGATLINGPHVSGANTSTLTLNKVSSADAGTYEVQMNSFCYAGVTSRAASLFLETSTVCKGDFNNDHLLDGEDVQGFVNAILAGEDCP